MHVDHGRLLIPSGGLVGNLFPLREQRKGTAALYVVALTDQSWQGWLVLGEDVFECVDRRIDRIAAGAQPEIVSRDLPPRAQLFCHRLGAEALAHQLGKRLFYRRSAAR